MICVFVACETPVAPQANAVSIPEDLTNQFFAGALIVYSCSGDLIPNDFEFSICIDNGPPLATWTIAATADLPECSKYETNCNSLFMKY